MSAVFQAGVLATKAVEMFSFSHASKQRVDGWWSPIPGLVYSPCFPIRKRWIDLLFIKSTLKRGFVVQCFDPRTLFLIEPLPRKDIVSVPEYGLAVHQPPHQLLRPAGLLPSAIEMIFLLLVLAISLDQGTAPIQLCLVSVSGSESFVILMYG